MCHGCSPGVFDCRSGKTEFQTTQTNRARRSVQFERRPSQRYARRQSHVMRERQRNVVANVTPAPTPVVTTVEEAKTATPVPPETADLLQLHSPSEPPSPSPLTPQPSLHGEALRRRNSPSRTSGSSTGSKRASAAAANRSGSPMPGTDTPREIWSI